MVRTPWRQPPLTREQENNFFMLLLDDDTEDAPWMTMGDLQFWSTSGFAHSLRNHARARGLGWYVASMLPITYDWPEASRRHQLSPDAFVAFVPEHARTSFNMEAEGGFPPFVLEVVSPSSVVRDEREKRLAYDMLGAKEYAIFTPRDGDVSTLAGYRRDAATGAFVPWQPDTQGRLWSDTLGLFLTVRGTLLQAETLEGRLLLTPEQADDARRQVEAENEQLRRELARYEQRDNG